MTTGHARTGPALAPSGPVASAPAARWHLPSARTVLLGSYFAVAAGLAIWWLVGQLLLWRVTRSARPVPEAIRDVFLGLAGPGSGRVVLLESDRIASPFTYTWRRPVILLPSSLCDGSEPGALRYVLAHEWSHVEGRDAWTWNLACLAGLVLFYQPLFWWLRRQLRLCQDYLADARAAAAGSAEDYAAFLVRLARVRRSTPAVPALGIGDRRSNLYRRVIMLMQDHEPLERRCRAAWSLCAATAAAVVIVFASGLRLGAAPPAADDPAKGAQAVKDAAKPSADAKDAGETLHYKGTVVDKDTGKPIAGATVVVRRTILRDPSENRVLQETRHTTGADGTYAFEIPPDQYASPYLYIELDVEHPDYAPRDGFGYALSMIRKNEKLNERPFFERIEMRPAQPITGRVETPEGRPAAGVLVLAYSRTDKAGGRLERLLHPGQDGRPGPVPAANHHARRGGVLGHAQGLCPRAVRGPQGEARRHGDDHLEEGRLRGRPGPGCSGQADRRRVRRDRAAARGRAGSGGARPVFLSSVIRRVAETDADGRFTFAPLPPGEYSVKPSETNFDGDRKIQWTHRPLPEVFAPTKLTIKEGETPAPLEIRALPSVVIEGRWVDSKGQPKGGWSPLVGRQDGRLVLDRPGPRRSPGPVLGEGPARTGRRHPHHHDQRARHDAVPDRQGRSAGRGQTGPGSARSTTTSRISRSSGTSRRSSSSTPPRRTASRSRISRRTSSTPSPARITARTSASVGGGKKKDAIQDEQYDGRYRTSNMLPDKEVTVSVSADGFEGASRKLSLPEGKTEEVTFVLEPKAPKGAGR